MQEIHAFEGNEALRLMNLVNANGSDFAAFGTFAMKMSIPSAKNRWNSAETG